MGKVAKGFLDDRFGYLLVATEENVIAALNVDNGDIVWRRILEKGDRGSIQYLQYVNDDTISSNSLRVSGRQEPDRFMISVAGTSFISTRVWNIRTGNLAWEWTMQLNNVRDDEPSHWFSTSTSLYHVQPTWVTSNIEITTYNIKTGHTESTTRKIPIGTVQQQDCDFVQSFIVCTNAGESFVIDLMSGIKKGVSKTSVRHKVVNVSTKIFIGLRHTHLMSTILNWMMFFLFIPYVNQGYEAAVQIDGKVYDLQTLSHTVVTNKGASPILFYARIKSTNSPILIETTLQDSVRN